MTRVSAKTRCITLPSAIINGPTSALEHLGLARAGDTAKACIACLDSFGLRKDADSDIPMLKEEKAEYAKPQ